MAFKAPSPTPKGLWRRTPPAVFPPTLGLLGLALGWLYALHLALAMMAMKHRPSLLELMIFPLMPLYQGILLKLLRFYAFTEEILFARSHHDTFVPERVRKALYGGKYP